MKIEIDIVILSYAKNDRLKLITQDCIESLYLSESPNEIHFNVLVIESEKKLNGYQYENAITIYPKEKFGFHKYLNIGKANTESDYICFCNNDLLFHKNWAKNILNQMIVNDMLMSASPVCSILHPKLGYQLNDGVYYGYEVREKICGWCIFTKRDLFKIIGDFDENFTFWYCDSDFAKVLEKHRLRHALVTDSVVDHLDGQSTKELLENEKKQMTSHQFWYFQYKWEHHNFLLYCWRFLRAKYKV